jgi:hypothetical protein
MLICRHHFPPLVAEVVLPPLQFPTKELQGAISVSISPVQQLGVWTTGALSSLTQFLFVTPPTLRLLLPGAHLQATFGTACFFPTTYIHNPGPCSHYTALNEGGPWRLSVCLVPVVSPLSALLFYSIHL